MINKKHNESIIDQFSKQADKFTEKMSNTQEPVLKLISEMTNVSLEDNVLDVACGPGLVTCYLAGRCKHATGLDITPAMIEKAKQIQFEKGLKNITWRIGSALPLPYPDESFSIVVTRYSFHHFIEPFNVFKEMVRVCKKEGTVLIADVVLPESKRNEFDKIEKLRDPSHVRVRTKDELLSNAESLKLKEIRTEWFKFKLELERQLQSSFSNPQDKEKIREILNSDININNTGMEPYLIDGKIFITYPTLILACKKN